MRQTNSKKPRAMCCAQGVLFYHYSMLYFVLSIVRAAPKAEGTIALSLPSCYVHRSLTEGPPVHTSSPTDGNLAHIIHTCIAKGVSHASAAGMT